MLNIAVIGCGYWGPNIIRNLNQIAGVNLKICCDIDKDKLDSIKKHYPNITTTTDLDFILNSEIDAVVIATSTSTHYELAKKALENGKHVFVEKPLATDSKKCFELIKLSENKKKILMVGHIFQFNPIVIKLKEFIDKNTLGKILYMHSTRTGLGPIRKDVNVMWDLASHDVSIILYLLNRKPIGVSAKGASFIQKGVEDIVFMTVAFEGNILANIHVSWLDPHKVRKTTVVGTKKMAVIDDTTPTEQLKIFDKGVTYQDPYSDYGEFKFLLRDGDISSPKINPIEPLKEELKHFVDCINEMKKPITDGVEGFNVVKVLEAGQKSLIANGQMIEIKW